MKPKFSDQRPREEEKGSDRVSSVKTVQQPRFKIKSVLDFMKGIMELYIYCICMYMKYSYRTDKWTNQIASGLSRPQEGITSLDST